MHATIATLVTAALGFAPANHARVHRVAGPSHRPATTARARSQMAALDSQLLGAINRIRVVHGLRPFRLSRGLTSAADQHSTSMVRKGYFSHASANGGAFWKRIASFYGYHGYHDWQVGENILWSSPDVSASGALNMWLTSPEHRANLLDSSWREIGLSAVHAGAAPGVYGGSAVTVVTADFGVRH